MSQASQAAGAVVCPAAKDPVVRTFIMAAMFIGFGVWCYYEAFIARKYDDLNMAELGNQIRYYFNHGGAIILPLLGLVFLVRGILASRKKLIADDSGIAYAGGKQLPWSAVKSIDSSDLAKKGILRLNYASSQGPDDVLVLDSWKLQNFKPLVAKVEQHVKAAPQA